MQSNDTSLDTKPCEWNADQAAVLLAKLRTDILKICTSLLEAMPAARAPLSPRRLPVLCGVSQGCPVLPATRAVYRRRQIRHLGLENCQYY